MGLTRPRAHQLQETTFKETCRAISTSNVTLSGGAPATVDGVSVSVGDRILVQGQSTGAENGIYRVTVVGTGSNGTWVRTADADATGDIKAGMTIMVTEGTTYADTSWKLTTDDPITVDTTALTFEQASAYAFGTVSADGTSLVADQVGDTLTVSAGTNISISGDADTDTMTLATVDAPTFTGNITGGNLITSAQVVATGNVTGGNLVSQADVTTATVTASGTVVATGNVTGGNLTTAGDVTTATVTASGAITGSTTITATGNVTAGNLTTAGQVVATGNITSSGNVSGTYILGDGSQLTNLATASFSTISVSGQSDIVADSGSDTLTFSAGTGITLTTDAGTDTLTITAESAAFPFAQDGDFESVTDDPASTTEDLGDLASTNATTYDLGSIISAEGLIYPGQLVLPSYATASLPDASVAAQLAYDTDTNSVKFTDGSTWNSYFTATGNIAQTSTDLVNSQSEGNYAQKRYILHGTTTDATETEIFVGGVTNTRIPIATDTTVTADAVFTARRTDATGHSAGFHIYAVADNFSGTSADVGSVYEVTIADDSGSLAVDIQADDTTDSLKVLVQGEASKTISWMCVVNTVEVSQ